MAAKAEQPLTAQWDRKPLSKGSQHQPAAWGKSQIIPRPRSLASALQKQPSSREAPSGYKKSSIEHQPEPPEYLQSMRDMPARCHLCGAPLPDVTKMRAELECAYCGVALR